MKQMSATLAVTAAFSIAVAGGSSSAAGANQTRLPLRTSGRAAFPWTRQRVPSNRRPQVTPSPCAGVTGSDSFVGETGNNGSGQSNFAGGQFSAVLGGIYNQSCDMGSAVGGGNTNRIGNNGNAFDSFIGGGTFNGILSDEAAIGSGLENLVEGTYGFIGGGEFNVAGGTAAVVGGGEGNYATGNGSVLDGGGYSFVNAGGGGAANQVTGTDSFLGAGDQNNVDAAQSAIVGGSANTVGSSATQSFIGSGSSNTTSSEGSFIGSGGINSISSVATYSAIPGGYQNVVSGPYASILGGFGNTISGSYAAIAGGRNNTAAGELSFAAGYHADAVNNGSFVWSDYSAGSALVKDTVKNEFVARASGGVIFYSNEGATTGVQLSPGEGTFASLSDRNAKTNIVPLDDASILAKVDALRVERWSYKSDTSVRHVGPMAQDFYAAFGTGVDDRHITSIDEDGVALAAIKALDEKLIEVRASEHRKDMEIGRLRANFAALSARVDALANTHRR